MARSQAERWRETWPQVAHFLGYGLVLGWVADYGLAQAHLVRHSADPLVLTASMLLIAVPAAKRR